jgi:hypothetical protein
MMPRRPASFALLQVATARSVRGRMGNYAGQAGAVATIGPPGDIATAEWMSKQLPKAMLTAVY